MWVSTTGNALSRKSPALVLMQMKSPIADMKNTGGRTGGAITAALFLRKFVDTDKVPSHPIP